MTDSDPAVPRALIEATHGFPIEVVRGENFLVARAERQGWSDFLGSAEDA